MKVKVFTEAVSPNIVHDACDSSIFGSQFICELNGDETEPNMECIEDCGKTKYVCDCNKYRYICNRLSICEQNISAISFHGSTKKVVNGNLWKIQFAHRMNLQQQQIQQPQRQRLLNNDQ